MNTTEYQTLADKNDKSFGDYIQLLNALNTETELPWIDDLVKKLEGIIV